MDKIVAVGLGEVLFDRDAQTNCELFGGAPANFAYHFLRCWQVLGQHREVEVHVVSAVGDDKRGEQIFDELQARGLCVDSMQRVDRQPTGLVDKQRDDQGVNRYTIHPAAWDQMAWSDRLATLADRADVVCFGSLAQRDLEGQKTLSRATIQRFVEVMRANGRSTYRIFDVNIRQHYYSKEVIERSITLCNILKISDEEIYCVATTLGYERPDDLTQFCRSLLQSYPYLEMLILTKGGAGSEIFTRTDHHCYTPEPIDSSIQIDTVGAGDSFAAALCATYISGCKIDKAQAIASHVAAFVCTQPSATPDYPLDAHSRFEIE